MTTDDRPAQGSPGPPVPDGYYVSLTQYRQTTPGPSPLRPPAEPDGGRHGSAGRMRLVLTLAVVAAVTLFNLGGVRGGAETQWALGDPLRLVLGDAARPTPQPPPSDEPLGRPQLAPPHAGPHRFLAFQPDSSVPVTYDPCRPLPYVVNARTAPPGGDVLLERAVRRVAAVTGLRFVYEGMTDEPVGDRGRAYQPDRYGDRWAPILVAWSDAAEDPHLAGEIAGTAGSVQVRTADGRFVYVTGTMSLDGPDLAAMLSRSRRGEAHVQAVIQHEFGHLLGLDHVDDAGQLMNPYGGHQTDFQSGDVTGLTRLGAGPCIPRL